VHVGQKLSHARAPEGSPEIEHCLWPYGFSLSDKEIMGPYVFFTKYIPSVQADPQVDV